MKHLCRGAVLALFLLGFYVPLGSSQTVPWSSLTNPSANLSLTMGGDTSTFNTTTTNLSTSFFSWANTTTGTAQVSPGISLCANYTGSSPDCWYIQNNTGGNKGLFFGHSPGQSSYAGAGGGVQFDSSMNTLQMYGQLSIGKSPSSGALASQAFIAMTGGANVATAIGNSFIASFLTSAGGPFNGMGVSHNGGIFAPIQARVYDSGQKTYTPANNATVGCTGSLPIRTPPDATEYDCWVDVSQTTQASSCTTSAAISFSLNWVDNFSGTSAGPAAGVGNMFFVPSNATSLSSGSTTILTAVTTTLTAAQVWSPIKTHINDAASGQVSACLNLQTAPVGCATQPTYTYEIACAIQ